MGLLIITRVFAVGCYAVRMPSMMPTLIGGPPVSDRILVDKISHRFRPLGRFDLIVFWSTGDQKSYIKRLVGLPGEHLQLARGDLVVDGEVLRKSLDQIRQMSIPVHLWQDGDSLAGPWIRSGEGWEPKDAHAIAVPNPLESVRLEYQPAIRDIYFDPDGSERKDRALIPERVSDLILTVEVEVEGTGSLVLELEEAMDHFELVVPLEGGLVRLLRNEETLVEHALPGGLEGRHRVLFANVDDRLHVRIDESALAFDVDFVQAPPVGAPTSSVSIEVRGGGAAAPRVAIEEIQLERDIHYRRSLGGRHPSIGRPDFLIRPNGYFFLGDNCPESRDSRDLGTVSAQDVIGRAVAIYWPWDRRRAL